ncbi:MAG: T9SS type A sorting domain-containing protein [Bacteroidota bacterium]|nr:T9SS type A sorting domain-containing protein [Bacteroidota bacterium]
MPKHINADVVGTDAQNPIIEVYADLTWAVLSSQTLTLSGFTVAGATSVTWNSDNLLFYAIVKTTGPVDRRLVTVDPATGVCTDIGSLGDAFSSLTYSSTTGILYGMTGSGATNPERLYNVSIVTGIPTFLAGPFSLGLDGEVIAYNYDDGFIYHWSGNGVANMEMINTTTFAATPVAQSGFTHGEIFGAVYQGSGNFLATEITNRALIITSAGVVSVQQTNLVFEPRGLGYVDPLLPVELSSFTSTINRRDVTLNWTTASELNNAGFDVERSLVNPEGSGWSVVGNVSGHGTTTAPMNYSYTDRNLASGKYNYRLKQIDLNGNFTYYELTNEVNVGVPKKFDLSQNYPNPFNPSTKINYDLPFDGIVSIKIFDMAGKEVSTLVNEVKAAGYYTLDFNASSLSSGIYFYRISAEANGQNFISTKKMMLIK